MADDKLIKILQRGSVYWNEWMRQKSEIKVDLSKAKFSGAKFGKAKLSGADLSGANLYNADLSGTNLSNVDLK